MKKLYILLTTFLSLPNLYGMTQSEPGVTGISASKQPVKFPSSVIEDITTIRNLLQDFGGTISEQIPFTNIHSATLIQIREALLAIQKLKQQYAEFFSTSADLIQQYGLMAIPGHVQRVANPILEKLTDQQLINIMNAANILQIDVLINAAAHVWSVRKKSTLENAQKHAIELGLSSDVATKYLGEQILTHAAPARSIADLILDNEQLKVNPTGTLWIRAKRGKKLTSLVGLNLIPDIAKTTTLNISNQLITHIDEQTFKPMPYLQTINLANNKLTTINPTIFTMITTLKKVTLYSNPLTRTTRNKLEKALGDKLILYHLVK